MEHDPQAQALGFRDRRADALGDLRVLPDETVCAILEFLTPRDVARLSCVSRFFFTTKLACSLIRIHWILYIKLTYRNFNSH